MHNIPYLCHFTDVCDVIHMYAEWRILFENLIHTVNKHTHTPGKREREFQEGKKTKHSSVQNLKYTFVGRESGKRDGDAQKECEKTNPRGDTH